MAAPVDANPVGGTGAQTQDDLDLLQYRERMNRPVRAKIPDFVRDERVRHVISSAQFSVDFLESLATTADQIRMLAKSREGHDFLIKLLRHKRAMLYFTQPSTRTFLSFTAACQILGITCNEVRNPSTSSEAKGETRFDSIRMFSSYFDVIIMRSVIARLAECCAYLMNDLSTSGNRSVPIINAGAGADEHPTQALLDIYTLQRTFQFSDPTGRTSRLEDIRRDDRYAGLTPGLANKVYGFCGDIGRGRTVRSLAEVLSLYKNVTMVFVAPENDTLTLRADLRDRLISRGVRVCEIQSLNDLVDGKPFIESVDALYMTRIQKEHNDDDDTESFSRIDFSHFCLTQELVQRMRPYAPILHPFPRDQHHGEIPPEIDNDSRAMYFRQARNGMWSRAALLANLFGVDLAINRHCQELYSEHHDYNESIA